MLDQCPSGQEEYAEGDLIGLMRAAAAFEKKAAAKAKGKGPVVDTEMEEEEEDDCLDPVEDAVGCGRRCSQYQRHAC